MSTFEIILPQPRLSIIIPCFNYEKYVKRAIQSVLLQKCDSCEVLVVDDGSTDSSWNVIEETGVNAVRIQNSGARLACLHGLSLTTGSFVLFLDADDELRPGSIQKILLALDEKVSKLQFSLIKVDSDGNTIEPAYPKIKNFRDRENLCDEVALNGVYRSPPTSGNVFRRDALVYLEQASYDHFVDGVTLFVAPFLGDIVSISEPLGLYRIHGRNDSGIGQNIDPMKIERDIWRFKLRMDHLKTAIINIGYKGKLFQTEKTFYYREQMLYLDLLRGNKIYLSRLILLLSALVKQKIKIKTKFLLFLFFIIVSQSGSNVSKRLIERRFNLRKYASLIVK